MKPRRVLVAPDKFKGSATSAEVAGALMAGMRSVWADAVEIDSCPVADGGEGTVSSALSAGFAAVSVPSVGPTGSPVTATIAVAGDRAIVELADVVGLQRLHPPGVLQPMAASTYGLGVVIRACLDLGARDLTIGVGGSASTDGGVGLLQALGMRFLDARGEEIARGGGSLTALAALDPTGLDARIRETTITVALDVDNPLLGPTGAARVYGPQKGAGPTEIELLERGLSRLAAVTAGLDISADHPGAGAAGGAAFGILAFLGGIPRRGADVVLDLAGFDRYLEDSDLIVTGEGSLDQQSLHGKAVLGVATRARMKGVPVVAVCGRCTLAAAVVLRTFDRAYSLSSLEPNPKESMRSVRRLLEQTGRRIARDWGG
jgi:glycerate kinase